MNHLAYQLGKYRLRLVLLIVGIIATCLYSFSSATAQTTFEQAKVTIDGIGPVRVGMTLQEAVNSANTPFTLKPGAGIGHPAGDPVARDTAGMPLACGAASQ